MVSTGLSSRELGQPLSAVPCTRPWGLSDLYSVRETKKPAFLVKSSDFLVPATDFWFLKKHCVGQYRGANEIHLWAGCSQFATSGLNPFLKVTGVQWPELWRTVALWVSVSPFPSLSQQYEGNASQVPGAKHQQSLIQILR